MGILPGPPKSPNVFMGIYEEENMTAFATYAASLMMEQNYGILLKTQ